MEDGEWVVRAEEQALVDFRQAAKVQQHAKAVGMGQGGNVSVEVGVQLDELLEGREEPLIQHQSVAAGVRSNNGGAFFQRDAQSNGIPGRLIGPAQAELIPNVAEQRQFAGCERSVIHLVGRVCWVELLRVRQDLHQCGSGVCATVHFFDRISPLRIDRDAGEEFIRVGPVRS